ncbi:hypothetical protein PHYSODRAFT_338812 [Phytophthora sojae]|uniref:Uncharacterized protein n=1 Tax=Phytophthora sojae (strain P6497) TaxID=1094619 RepID=G5A382_PHYSP|nr:hypothetical protein PHYSODRAFT_338812 [Phytophthora sojae]EGZ10122.1 hypothetical protein PHYSODRAFT_338812 [Phytophthora sojae]|eukprot:XP_009534983.1 hypothetical protein PHYSODRAFT_338812 [Phytophthora sojae]
MLAGSYNKARFNELCQHLKKRRTKINGGGVAALRTMFLKQGVDKHEVPIVSDKATLKKDEVTVDGEPHADAKARVDTKMHTHTKPRAVTTERGIEQFVLGQSRVCTVGRKAPAAPTHHHGTLDRTPGGTHPTLRHSRRPPLTIPTSYTGGSSRLHPRWASSSFPITSANYSGAAPTRTRSEMVQDAFRKPEQVGPAALQERAQLPQVAAAETQAEDVNAGAVSEETPFGSDGGDGSAPSESEESLENAFRELSQAGPASRQDCTQLLQHTTAETQAEDVNAESAGRNAVYTPFCSPDCGDETDALGGVIGLMKECSRMSACAAGNTVRMDGFWQAFTGAPHLLTRPCYTRGIAKHFKTKRTTEERHNKVMWKVLTKRIVDESLQGATVVSRSICNRSVAADNESKRGQLATTKHAILVTKKVMWQMLIKRIVVDSV